jgi:hypothetical protein
VRVKTLALLMLWSGLTQFAQAQTATTGSVEGVVLDQQGKPIPDANVWALPERDMRTPISTTSDASGKFILHDIPIGNVYILAFKESEGYPYEFYAFYKTKNDRSSAKVEAKPGAVTSGVTIQLGPKAAYLKVDATDENGASVKVAYQLDRDDMPGPYSTTVPTDPRLVGVGFIDGVMLVPPMPFRLTVLADGYQPWHYGGANWKGKAGLVNLQSGQTLDLAVRLRRKDAKLLANL